MWTGLARQLAWHAINRVCEHFISWGRIVPDHHQWPLAKPNVVCGGVKTGHGRQDTWPDFYHLVWIDKPSGIDCSTLANFAKEAGMTQDRTGKSYTISMHIDIPWKPIVQANISGDLAKFTLQGWGIGRDRPRGVGYPFQDGWHTDTFLVAHNWVHLAPDSGKVHSLLVNNFLSQKICLFSWSYLLSMGSQTQVWFQKSGNFCHSFYFYRLEFCRTGQLHLQAACHVYVLWLRSMLLK